MAEDVITAFDERGREVKIPKKEWAEKILPENLRRAWDDPEALYGLLVAALKENLAAAVADAAARLEEIDPVPERAAVIRGIVLIQLGKAGEAEHLFKDFMYRNGETGAVLTNLAKIYYDRGDPDLAEATLRRGLELDPNMDNGLGWYAAAHRQRGGDDAALAALREISRVPRSWRPQLWIARDFLKKDRADEAIALYRQVLIDPGVQGDGLMMITGDLGGAGKVAEMIDLVLPVYDLNIHGPFAGLNLLHALITVGHAKDAAALLQKLQSLNNPLLANYLGDASARLAKASAPNDAPPAAEDGRIQVAAVPLLNPIWTAALSRPDWLLPPLKPDAVKVAIFSLADATRTGEQATAEVENDTGRLSRALPMYLAEALRLRSDAASVCVIPVVPKMGPIVTGAPWPLPHMLSACPDEFPPDIVVCGALTRGARGAKVELHVFRAKDKAPLKTLRIPAADDFTGAAARSEQELLSFLASHGVQALHSPAPLPPPAASDAYLSSLAQLFSQSLVASGIVDANRLWNERGIFESHFALVDQSPDTPLPLLVAAAGVIAALRYKSTLVETYKQPLLEKLKIGADRFEVIRQLTPVLMKRLGETEAYESSRANAQQTATGAYADWLAALGD